MALDRDEFEVMRSVDSALRAIAYELSDPSAENPDSDATAVLPFRWHLLRVLERIAVALETRAPARPKPRKRARKAAKRKGATKR